MPKSRKHNADADGTGLPKRLTAEQETEFLDALLRLRTRLAAVRDALDEYEAALDRRCEDR
jgi:hypothetical protein